MYAEKYAPLKKGTVAIKTNSGRGNLTGIPTSMKNHYEAASGLSFDDVRVHYNSEKPGKMQALAYTQGNHVYIGPGQERHLQHELGHVIQQKQGIVRPNVWINGLPVNTDRGLEQQAESGIIPLVRTAPESRQDIVQGVFLKWVNDGTKLVGVENDGDIDTKDIDIVSIFFHLQFFDSGDINYANSIKNLNMEINTRYQEIRNNIEDILAVLHSMGDSNVQQVLGALALNCCNYLWHMIKQVFINYPQPSNDEETKAVEDAQFVKKLLTKRFSYNSGGMDMTYYRELSGKISKLSQKIDDVSGLPEGEKKEELKKLLGWEFMGYLRLKQRFKWDRNIRRLSLAGLRRKLFVTFGYFVDIPDDLPDSGEMIPVNEPMSNTYAAEMEQQVNLPAYEALNGALIRNNPVERSGIASEDDAKIDLAKNILSHLDSSESLERLVVYRGMGVTEALSILSLFNSGMATGVEAAVRSGSINIHDEKNIASLGKHYGERIQAEKYITDTSQEAKVLLAFILKPGAKKLLFSQSLLALPKNLDQDKNPDNTPKVNRSGFKEANSNEGTLSTYIGLKREKVQVDGVERRTFSLGVAQKKEGNKWVKGFTQLLLQLLIDRVEMVEMRLPR